MNTFNKVYNKILFEGFSNPYKFKNSFQTEMVDEIDDESGQEYKKEILSPVQIIKFTTEKNISYVWYARRNRYDDTMWEIAFGVDNGTDEFGTTKLNINKTNTGDAFRVFSTVIEITNNFIEYDENYEVVKLSIRSESENRTNLYIKRLLPLIDNFKITDTTRHRDETTIILTRTN